VLLCAVNCCAQLCVAVRCCALRVLGIRRHALCSGLDATRTLFTPCMRMPVLVWRREEWPACSLLPLPWGESIAFPRTLYARGELCFAGEVADGARSILMNLSLFHELCTHGANCASQERWLIVLARF